MKHHNTPDEGEMINVSSLYPNQDVLGVIGSVCFLCFHAAPYKNWSMQAIGKVFEPSILLKKFKLYKAGGIPRAVVTWAHMDDTAQAEYLHGQGLSTIDQWESGDTLWITDIIAPWGHGSKIIADILATIPENRFFALRVKAGRTRVAQWHRAHRHAKWRLRYIEPNVDALRRAQS